MRYMGEFDGIDDELFSERLDFRAAPAAIERPIVQDPARGLIMPEPATVRLEERTPHVPYERGYTTYWNEEREDRDPILLVALAGLLVLVLISTGVVFWWFA